tara:strand:- start:52 stop:516 length:465 start_codon:yes stop_codon:yes gene_type:complete
MYLKLSIGGAYHPDFVTHYVARQSTGLISKLGYNAEIIAHETKAQMVLNINGSYLASIIEGCNSISIIILFIAFIVAFAQKFKKTFIFIFAGSLLIYVVNVIRIVILAIALYNYPNQEKFLHGVVFPGIIYGMVFLLWMLWIKMLVPKNEAKNE